MGRLADRLTELREAAWEIATSVVEGDDLSECELVDLFVESGFFSTMGYGSMDTDVRCSSRVVSGQVDVILRSFTGRPIALLEFLPSDVDLAECRDQLEEGTRDVLGRLPSVAALTNGSELWLFQTEGGYLQEPSQKFNLAELQPDEAEFLHTRFQRGRTDWQRHLRSPHLPD